MSGHSKWSKIKSQKGSEDLKRGQQFTKIGRAITLAVKEGGGVTDPSSNFKLRLAIDKAKVANMPKDNIQRAIDRGSGKGDDGAQIEHNVYEGYAPYGIAVLIEAATDNKQRTGADVKHALEKSGGNLGTPGSVSFQFNNQGLIVIDRGDYTDDQMLDMAIECGAEDVEPSEEEFDVYTDRAALHEVTMKLQDKGCHIKESELTYRPITPMVIDDEDKQKRIISVLETIDDLDDVQKVYANVDFATN